MILKRILLITITLILSTSFSAFAATELSPLQVGGWKEYAKCDSNCTDLEDFWTVRYEALNQATIGSTDYFNVGLWDYVPGTYYELLARSTETALFAYHPVYGDRMLYQLADPGTIWSYKDQQGGVNGRTWKKILSIGSVTVPYGTFDDAYLHVSWFNPNDPSLQNSPFNLEYVVADIGMVKEVNFNWGSNKPSVQVLKAAGVVPEPVSSTLFVLGGALFGLRSLRKRKKS